MEGRPCRCVQTCVVSDRDANLLGFTFDGHQYIDTRLPFGCRSSPFLFNLFAEALHWMLEQRSITSSHYLDDFFGATNGEAEKTLQVFKSLSQTLGLSVQDKKLEHGHALEILGILVEARRGTAIFSEERRRGILHTLDTTLSRKTATALELMSVAEHLVFISRICPPGRAFLRRIYAATSLHLPQRRRIPYLATLDLRWWRDVLRDWDGILLLNKERHRYEVWSDASTTI